MRFVWCDAAFAFVDPKTREPMPIPERDGPQCPQVIPDTPGYQSPVTGEWIEGRRARRYDLERHNCVEYEPTANAPDPERFGEKKRQKAKEDAEKRS